MHADSDRIRCPTLVLRGPRPQTLEVAGLGHAPMFLDAGQIAITRDFLFAA